jgi:hypothetical protein
MKTLILVFFLLASTFGGAEPHQVCVRIDGQKTSHPDYPNQATEVGNHLNSFYVYHGKTSCFDGEKSYYLQHFLWETPNTIVYGTICRYTPKIEHEGYIVQFIGESGSYDCPVIKQ